MTQTTDRLPGVTCPNCGGLYDPYAEWCILEARHVAPDPDAPEMPDLASGGHGNRDDGVCLLEAVAWAAGQDHGDMPPCVSPVLRRFGIRLNDRMRDDERQQLKRFIPYLIGTAGDGHDEQRTTLALEWLMREALPEWLDLAHLTDLAEQSRTAPTDRASLLAVLASIREVTWPLRRDRYAKIRATVRAKLAEKPAAVAVADAVADADAAAAAAAAAAAVADAAAAAVADAVAVADADAVAVAVAVAVAAAAAVADAAADADAAAAAAGSTYSKAYAAARKVFDASPEYAAIRALRDRQIEALVSLYDRMIHVGRAA